MRLLSQFIYFSIFHFQLTDPVILTGVLAQRRNLVIVESSDKTAEKTGEKITKNSGNDT
jgi:hypothetical protein